MTALLFYARIAASLFVAASFLGLALTVALGMAQRRLTARRRRRADRPPVSVVIPIKALDEGFAEAQASIFAQDYPDFDLTITAKETSSPAIDAARAALAAHPHAQARIVRSTANFAASPKVNNLYQAVEDAPHDVIFMKDSNIEIPQNGMSEAVACLDEGVGLVVAVVEAHGAENFAAEIEASIMNQSHGRILAAAAALGLGFGVGKLMVFRRSDLHRAGGFQAISHSVGEDSALARKLEEFGLRTVFMGPAIFQRLGRRRIFDVFHRQLRWTVIRRHNETLAFLIEPLGLASCAALAAAFAAPLWGAPAWAGAAGALILWFAFETLLALARGWDVSKTAPLAMIARDAMMFAVWLSAWFTRNVVWAAQVFEAHRENEPAEAPQVAKGKDK